MLRKSRPRKEDCLTYPRGGRCVGVTFAVARGLCVVCRSLFAVPCLLPSCAVPATYVCCSQFLILTRQQVCPSQPTRGQLHFCISCGAGVMAPPPCSELPATGPRYGEGRRREQRKFLSVGPGKVLGCHYYAKHQRNEWNLGGLTAGHHLRS